MSSTESSSNEPSPTPATPGPLRGTVALAVFLVGLLGALVWALWPERTGFRPAPLRPLSADCPTVQREFVPSNITALPPSLLDGLTAAEKNRALYRLNMEPCTCGCASSVAACRINNPNCPTSRALAERVVAEVRAEQIR